MRIYFIIGLFLISTSLFSQENKLNRTSQEIIDDYIEEISSNTDKSIDMTTLYEDLTYYLNEPLNINIATKEDLDKLQLLSDFQISSLITYIKDYGQLLSIYELLNVNGFNEEYVRLIMPFVTVEKTSSFLSFDPKKALKYGTNNLYIRTQRIVQQQQGYSPISDSALAASPDSRYLGDPMHYYVRYSFNYKNKLSWGITADKDPGEEFFTGTQKNGFDFYSAFFMVKDIGPIKTIVLGDYYAQFGQGLVVFSGYSPGKSSMVTNTRKRAQGLKKYSGADENLFFRGGGITLRYKSFDFTTFASDKKIDANMTLTDSITGEAEEVSTLQTTGLHATPSEMKDRKVIGETVLGGNVSFNSEIFRLGLTGLTYSYSAPLMVTPTLYNQYVFSGKQNSNVGFDYQMNVKNVTLFGEAAMSQNGGKAIVSSLLFSLSPQTSMALLYRNYERNYQAFFSNSFGENSTVTNETGMYIGAVILPYPRWSISAYYDLFSFPWLKFETYAPSKGSDYLAEINFAPSRKVSMTLRYRQKIKPLNIPSTIPQVINGVEESTTKHIRYNISCRVNKSISLSNRIEWVQYGTDEKTESGIYFYQNVSYQHPTIPFSISIRYGIFDTDSYDTRIYAFESDVLNAFSVPAVYYKGNRFYLTLKYSISKNIDIWLRYGETYYANQNVISSGLNQINGNKQSEVKAQVRVSF